MGVRVIGGNPTDGAALYDSVTGRAFGPVFESSFEAEEFLNWWQGPDLRSLMISDIEEHVARWQKEREGSEN